ncbi:MAG: ErfK/YbiS/YcfS/YnhG family protein [Streptosporangiaceae bacterium]|nr:ErfK/YbiS/YcfS/YnhG family protein [Streptosporangiaceae bacterium]
MTSVDRQRRTRVIAGTAAGMSLALAATACSGTKAVNLGSSKTAVALTVTPSDGGGAVRPDSPIMVKAFNGKIQNVTVTNQGAQVVGATSPDGKQWQSRWVLSPGTRYQVMATGFGVDGKTQTVKSTFTTVKPAKTLAVAVTAPDEGEKVGVGMPVILHFDSDVTNRAEIERNLEVRASTPVVGAWHWLTSQDLIYRPKVYWPVGTKVHVIGHLSGAQATKSAYGAKDIDLHFQIGDSHITTASSTSHSQVIRKNGKIIRRMPLSMGRGGLRKYTTTNGIHLAMDKEYLTVMDSSTTGCGPGCPDYYREDVYWTVRISDSGEYEHSAPWSVGDQGYSNVSHGCINLSPDNAIWFFHFSQRGDIIKVTGTPRELEPGNGWGFWQENWNDWLRYSTQKGATTLAMDGTGASVISQVGATSAPATPDRTPAEVPSDTPPTD